MPYTRLLFRDQAREKVLAGAAAIALLNTLLLSVLDRSDQVLMVVDMDLPSVKNAKLALDVLRLLRFPAGRISVVLNRSNAKARLDTSEIERSLQMKIGASIPSDGLVPASVNEGVPLVVSAPRSKVAKGYESVFRLVAQSRTAKPAQEGKRRWL